MRFAGRPSVLLGALAILVTSFFVGCDNPIDPLDKSAKIQGLSYIDFSATWDRWDSDPEYDGVVFTIDYTNEFGDGLAFHDKPHNVVIEFWTQREEGTDDATFIVRDRLFFSKTIVYENSDDDIRIPIEAYYNTFQGAGFDPTEEVSAFVLVRVFPPEGYPRTELIVGQPDIVLFKPQSSSDTPNS